MIKLKAYSKIGIEYIIEMESYTDFVTALLEFLSKKWFISNNINGVPMAVNTEEMVCIVGIK